MNSCELIAFISSISCVLFENLSKEELANIATILTQLSVTLSTMLAHDELCNNQLPAEGDIPLEYL